MIKKGGCSSWKSGEGGGVFAGAQKSASGFANTVDTEENIEHM